MSKEILTRCGYRCDLCLAYAENIQKDDQRELLSEDIIRRKRVRRYSDIRKAIVLLSEIYADITNTELARKLNIPLSMVSKI